MMENRRTVLTTVVQCRNTRGKTKNHSGDPVFFDKEKIIIRQLRLLVGFVVVLLLTVEVDSKTAAIIDRVNSEQEVVVQQQALLDSAHLVAS